MKNNASACPAARPAARSAFPDPARRLARQRAANFLLRLLVRLASLLTAGVLLFLVGYILVMGVPNLKPSLFAWEYNSENVSLVPAAINTLFTIILTLLICLPLGIGAAIYLVEYTGRGNRLVGLVRITAETLSGIPSIVYGLFGMLCFVTALHWGRSILAGACTLAVMILPVIMRTTEEALLAVPDSFREGSFALGAGKLRTIFRIILPAAVPGIVSGVILGLGRVVGETMALIFTAGSAYNRPFASGPMQQGSTLTVYLYSLCTENTHPGVAWAVAVVLIILVVIINGLAEFIGNKLKKEY